jgi:hypothetical protein
VDTAEIIQKVAEKDFDLDAFVRWTLEDESVRADVVRQMLTSPAIMVYYHCYYVAERASRERPELFYAYWDAIAGLLHHDNSYHRDLALEIIGNLTRVDHEDRFAGIADVYFGTVNDVKFMTGNCCVRNLLKIYRHKAGQRARVIETRSLTPAPEG